MTIESFNTDDGIRRAAIRKAAARRALSCQVSIPMTVLGGLQWALWRALLILRKSFNTDDGIRRAAILCP